MKRANSELMEEIEELKSKQEDKSSIRRKAAELQL